MERSLKHLEELKCARGGNDMAREARGGNGFREDVAVKKKERFTLG